MKKEIELVAHLYRRAGFGESRENIDMIAKDNYEGVVEKLLNPDPKERLGIKKHPFFYSF